MMQMRESDDVIGGSTKTVQHSIEIISRNVKAMFFKLGTTIVQAFALRDIKILSRSS